MSLHEQLSRLLSGDLPEAEGRRLRERIRLDPEVAEAWEEMKVLASGLDDLPEAVLSEGLVSAVLAPEPRSDPSRLWAFLGVAALAAAAMLAVQSPTPAHVTLGVGTHTIAGNALVEVGDTAVRVDGRAQFELVPSTEEPHMKTAMIGAVAGTLLTVAVYEGSARISGPSGETEVRAGESWKSPEHAVKRVVKGLPEAAAPAIPTVSVTTLAECRDSVDELTTGLEQSQLEASFLRGQLANHEGDPVPWPKDVPEALLPANLEAAFTRAFEDIGSVVHMDCEEYPCIVVVDEGDSQDTEAWKAAVDVLQEQLGDTNTVVGRAKTEDEHGSHALGAYAITPGDVEVGPRTKFRLDQAMESFGN